MSHPPAQPWSPTAAAPVCPRHPQRTTYVRCQRCERPVCNECAQDAAVGVQCPDCVREGQRATRQDLARIGVGLPPAAPNTGFAGAVARTFGIQGQVPLVTISLILLCVAAFILQQVDSSITTEFALWPPRASQEPWTVITSAFLHLNVVHLLLNMVALWAVGPYVEAILGRGLFLISYLVCAIGGSAAVLLLSSPASITLGASGAIYGLFAVVMMLQWRLRQNPMAMLTTIALNLALSFVVLQISWQAHVGGLLTGLALGAAAVLPSRAGNPLTSQKLRQRTLLALAVVALAVLAITAWALWGRG